MPCNQNLNYSSISHGQAEILFSWKKAICLYFICSLVLHLTFETSSSLSSEIPSNETYNQLFKCPEGPTGIFCMCFDNTVNCSFCNLQSLPYDFDLNTTILDISFNHIISLDWDFLSHFTNLKTINLTGNKLQYLSYSVNELLTKELYIDNCGLNYFNFSSFCNIIVLSASRNYLNLPPEAFSCMENLEEINLSYNDLIFLPANIFDGLENIKFINLAGNPWNCDCSLLWLRLFLKTFSASGKRIGDENNTLCSATNESNSVTLTSETNSELLCDKTKKLQRKKKSSDYQVDWTKICYQLKLSLNLTCGTNKAVSCIYDFSSQSYSLLQYNIKLNSTLSLTACRNQCYKNGAHYFLFINEQCLCGDLNSTDSCNDCKFTLNSSQKLCNEKYTNIPGAKSIFYDLYLSISTSLLNFIYKVNFNVIGGPDTLNNFTWNFGDGITSVTSDRNVSHTYTYPNSFKVAVTFNSINQLKIYGIDAEVNITEKSTTASLKCPSLASTSEKLNISATFASSWEQNVHWSRTPIGRFGMNICESDWQPFKYKCIKLKEISTTMTLANQDCKNLGGQLIQFYSESELEELISMLNLSERHDLKIYTDATWSEKANIYVWNSTRLKAFVFKETLKNSTDVDCVLLNHLGLFGVDCGEKMNYVCEKTPQCQGIIVNRTCNIFFNESVSWEESEKICSTSFNQGHLAVVPDDYFNTIFAKRAARPFWIGLKASKTQGQFYWSNGEVFYNLANQTKISGTEPCVSLDNTTMWISQSCSNENYFICQYDLYDKVSTHWQIAGTMPVLEDIDHRISFNIEQSSNNGNIYSFILPGSWFTHFGEVVSWNFKTKPLNTSTKILLQIWRPFCNFGIMVKPGCGSKNSLYSCQTNFTFSCADYIECDVGQVYCPLSLECQSLSLPCTCAGVASKVNISCDIGNVSLNFTLVSSVNITIQPNTTLSHYVLPPNTTMTIEPGDVIGFQTENYDIIICDESSASIWQQPLLWMITKNWLKVTDFIEGRAYKLKQNVTCYLNAAYTEKAKLVPPEYSSYITSPGNYTFSLHGDNLETQTCDLSILNAVGGLIWVYPPMSSINQSIAVVNVESGIEQIFVVKILYGSDITVTWTDNKGKTILSTMNTSCPVIAVNTSFCKYNGSFLDAPYSIALKKLLELETIILNVSVFNKINAIHFIVAIQSYSLISGLEFFHSNCSNHTHCVINLEVGLNHTFYVSIKTGTNVTVTYYVNNLRIENSLVSTKDLVYMFPNPDQYVLAVTVSNPLSRMSCYLIVFASNRANFTTVQFVNMEEKYFLDTIYNLTLRALISYGARLNIIWYIGDESFLDSVISSNTSDYRKQHSFKTPGNITIHIILTDAFGSSITKRITLFIYKNIQTINLNTSSNIQATHESLNLTVSVDSMAEMYTGYYGNLTYLVNWGDGNDFESWADVQQPSISLKHIYVLNGAYTINVTVISDLQKYKQLSNLTDVIIQDKIGGLELNYNGPKHVSQEIVFTVNITEGTDVVFSLSFGDELQVTQNNSVFPYKYSNASVYEAKVLAKNLVSQETQSLILFAYDEYLLQIIKLSFPQCVALNSSVLINSQVAAESPEKLFYNWMFGNENVINGTGLWETPIVYQSIGNYNISLTVSNTTTSKSDTMNRTICVQEIISGTSLNFTSPFGFDQSLMSVDVPLIAMVNKGTNMSYSWSVDTGIRLISNNKFNLKVTEPRNYTVTVNISNNINKESITAIVQVISLIKGLQIICKQCSAGMFVRTHLNITFTAELIYGNLETYDWTIENSSETFNGKTLNYLFDAAGDYVVYVRAKNSLSFENVSLTIQAQDEINGITALASPSVALINQSVLLQVSWMNGTHVTTDWICDLNKATGDNNISQVFSSEGFHTCSVKLKNNISRLEQSFQVQIQALITNLSVCHSFNESRTLPKLYAAVGKRSILTLICNTFFMVQFDWAYFGKTDTILNQSGKIFNITFLHADTGYIVLKASNNFSQMNQTLFLDVQEEIRNLNIRTNISNESNIDSPLIVSVRDNVLFNATLDSGTSYTTQWYQNGTLLNFSDFSGSQVIAFENIGSYQIVLVAYNAVSNMTKFIVVVVLEPVSNLSIIADGITNFPFLKKGSFLNFLAPTVKGSNLVYNWSIGSYSTSVIFTSNTSRLSYTFNESGSYMIKLKVYNDINSEHDEMIVFAQGSITKLNISIANNVIITGTNISLSANINKDSTNVTYLWNISGDVMDGPSVIYVANKPGVQNIFLTAQNNVSISNLQSYIYVLDTISNLSILDCSAAQEVNKSVFLKSVIEKGTNVTFKWFIEINKGNVSYSGQNINFTFTNEGVYTVYLIAVNDVSKRTVSCKKHVFFPIGLLNIQLIESSPEYIFQNQNITFIVIGDHLNWSNFNWTVISLAQSVLISSSNYFTTSFSIVGNYTISVNVSNSISYAISKFNITVKECLCKLPNVTIVGTGSYTYQRSVPIELEVNVDTEGCTFYISQHKWSVFLSDECSNLTFSNQVSLGNTRLTSLKLNIQPRTLSIGNYCVCFTTGYHYTSVAESVFLKLNITSTSLKAIIKGGNKRNVAVGREFCMDASLSLYPDFPESQLAYTWQCTVVSSSGSCFTEVKKSRYCYQDFSPGEYRIILKVEAPGSEPVFDEQRVIVVNDLEGFPSASIVCDSCARSGHFFVSASTPVTLSAACDMCQCQPYFAWSIYENEKKITPDISQNPTGLQGQNLVLSKWGVIKDNWNYTFVLDVSCQKEFLKNGSASLKLIANSPPVGEICTFMPIDIIPLQNQVTVSCLDWTDLEDPDISVIYSIYVDFVNKGVNEKLSYLLYSGTSKVQSVFLTTPYGESVILRVMVTDYYGASSLGGTSSINFKALALPANMTTTDYLIMEIDSKMSTLIKQATPISIIQFAIAVSFNLNRESNNDQFMDTLLEQKRSAIRDVLAICLSTSIPIVTVTDVEQIAYALMILTDNTSEFLTKDSQLLILTILRQMQNVIKQMIPTIVSQEDVPISSLAGVITNLLKAVNMPVHKLSQGLRSDKIITVNNFTTDFRNLRPEMSSVVSKMDFNKIGLGETYRQSVISTLILFLEDIIITTLKATVIGEGNIKIKINDMKFQGQRCYAKDISTYNLDDYTQFNLKPEILVGQTQTLDEVLEILISYKQNPYTYGYVNPLYESMSVQTISFYEANGSAITIRGLGEMSSVKMNMISSSIVSQTDLVNSTIIYDPLKNLTYSTVSILPKKNKLWQIPNTLSELQKGVGIHIQLRIQFLPNDTSLKNVKGSHVICYLGLNYSPSSSEYIQKLMLTSELMESGTDHRLFTFFSNQVSTTDKLYVMATNYDKYLTVKLSVATYYSICQYFNTTNQKWAQDGCWATDLSTVLNVSCQCNHLTSFGGVALAPVIDFDFADLADLDLTTNPVVFIAVTIIFCIYLIIAFICKYFDRMDLKRISRIPLCGRDGNYKYKITFFTGRLLGAGTSANVGIKLYGSESKGSARHLNKTGAFHRNCQDSFLVAFDTSLGSITKILVWHDNTGLSPSWFLSYVVVQDVQTQIEFTFIINSWLSLNMEDGSIQKTVNRATDEELKKFKNKFSFVFYTMLAEMHTWLSVSNRSDHSKFTRVQRATCCLTCTYLYMGINAIWYGVFKTKSETDSVISWSSFGWEEIIIALVSTFMVLPLLFGLSALFKRTRFKDSALAQARRPSTAKTLEIDADIDLFSTSESIKTITSLVDCEMPSLEKEYSLDSLPGAKKLKRTAPIHGKSMKRKNNEMTYKKSNEELWCKENIMCSWPNSVPDCMKEENSQSKLLPLQEKNSNGELEEKVARTRKTSTSTVSDRRKSSVISDDEFDKQLNELSAEIDRIEKRRKQQQLKKMSKKNAEDLFDSDDDWAYEGLEQLVCSSSKQKNKSISVRRKPELDVNIERKQSKINKEIDEDDIDIPMCHYIGKRQSIVSFSSKTKTNSSGQLHSLGLGSQNSTKKKHGCTLPPWCLYVTYAICGKLCLLSIILVLWYGYKFGSSIALKWIVSLCFSVFASILVVEPIKVILISVIVKFLKEDAEESDSSLLNIIPVADYNEQLKDVKFKPLAGIALLHATEEGKKKQRLYTLLREAVMFITMFALILSIVYINYNCHIMYLNNQNIQNKLYNRLGAGNFRSKFTLSNLKSSHHFWLWAQNIMARVIHLNELDLTETFGILMGPAWLRQIRGEKGKVSICFYLCNSLVTCPVALSSALHTYNELDTKRCVDVSLLSDEPNGQSWKIGMPNTTFYHSADLNMYSKFGKSLLYTGSGYVQKLGHTYNETLKKLKNLEASNWIDKLTRAIFIEFTLYSASTDLTTCGSVLIEFPLTGSLLSSTTVQSEKLVRYVPDKVEPLLVCQVIFLLFVLYLTVILYANLHAEKLHYFLGFWNWIDFIICLLAWTSCCLYLICVLKSTYYIDKFLSETLDSAYVAQVVLMHAVYRYLHACLVFLFCLKVARQVRFSRPLYKLYMMLSSSCASLIGVFFIFILLLLFYAQLGLLVFGASLEDYSSFQKSITCLFSLMFGKNEYLLEISKMFSILSPIYFISFCFIAYGLLMAMTIAILRWSYRSCKSYIYYKTTLEDKDYEMIDFMIEQFKLLIGMKKQKPAFRKVKFADQQSLSCPSTISSMESNQQLTCLSSQVLSSRKISSSSGDPVGSLQKSWDKFIYLMEKVEEAEKFEDETTNKLKNVVEVWKSIQIKKKYCSNYHHNTYKSWQTFKVIVKNKNIQENVKVTKEAWSSSSEC